MTSTPQRWVSFDCYGTLVDWRRGLAAALEPHVGERAEAVLMSALALSRALEAQRPYRSYRDILADSVRLAADQAQRASLDTNVLIHAWPMLPFFDDVCACLNRLRDHGWRIAVLTNCDDDLFATTSARLGVHLDQVVTAEQVRSYKPRGAHFEEFRRRERVDPSNWVHVANSWVADLVPAHEHGIPCIWVNRDRDTSDPALVAITMDDLNDLQMDLARLGRPQHDAGGRTDYFDLK
jgi:2-haloacid dehalogenase